MIMNTEHKGYKKLSNLKMIVPKKSEAKGSKLDVRMEALPYDKVLSMHYRH